MNPDCENFGKELKEHLAECSLCGRETGNFALKFNPGLVIPSIIASLGLSIGYFLLSIAMYHSGINMGVSYLFNLAGEILPANQAMHYSAFALYVITIIIAYFSNSKKALAVSIAAMPVVVAVLRLIVL